MQRSPSSSYLLPHRPIRPKFHSTIFSDTLNLCFSLRVRDKILHLYKTRDKITGLHILLILKFLGNKRKDKWFWSGW
jgi:hypothetical protein